VQRNLPGTASLLFAGKVIALCEKSTTASSLVNAMKARWLN
jgi:hypothetical protein